ncbi:MAG: V-type ATPase subunit [bacterium]
MKGKTRADIDSYGYINARVRVMKSLLLGRDFYEELIRTHEFMSLISLLEKSPYRVEVEECAISKSEMAGVDEALKRNLARNFRRILNFTAGEPHDLILLLLGRWDLHNIITLLRGVHIKETPEQILESLIPAGELEIPFLEQLSQQKTIKEIIGLLAVWGSSYAKALNDKYKEYIDQNDLPILELSLYKAYYQYVLDLIKNKSYNSKILEELIFYEIDAINATTILRLQLMNIEDLMHKKEEEKKTEKKEEKKGKKGSGEKVEPEPQKEENTLWGKLLQERRSGGIIFTTKKKSNILIRLLRNSFYLLKEYFKSSKIICNCRKKYVTKYGTKKIVKEVKLKDTVSYTEDDVKKRVKEYFVPGGNEISEERFVKMCLTMDVENVLKELGSTSFGVILKSVLQRFLEHNSISVLERKIEEMVIKRGASVYNKNSLSVGIPIGYIWRKYNEVVNLRIIMRCKKVGMPESKIREELVLI